MAEEQSQHIRYCGYTRNVMGNVNVCSQFTEIEIVLSDSGRTAARSTPIVFFVPTFPSSTPYPSLDNSAVIFYR